MVAAVALGAELSRIVEAQPVPVIVDAGSLDALIEESGTARDARSSDAGPSPEVDAVDPTSEQVRELIAAARDAAAAGACPRAAEIARLVREVDPERYRALVAERLVSACKPEAAPVAMGDPEVMWGRRVYVEPSGWGSMSFGKLSGEPAARETRFLGRIAAGIRVTRYAAGGAPSLRFHVGATAYFSPRAGVLASRGGVGGELVLDAPVVRCVRLGGRLEIATAEGNTALVTFGPRAYLGTDLSLGLDLYQFTGHPEAGTGVMFGIGFTGDLGSYLVGPWAALVGLIGISAEMSRE